MLHICQYLAMLFLLVSWKQQLTFLLTVGAPSGKTRQWLDGTGQLKPDALKKTNRVTADNAIYWINHSVSSGQRGLFCQHFSTGQRYPTFEQLTLGFYPFRISCKRSLMCKNRCPVLVPFPERKLFCQECAAKYKGLGPSTINQ